MTKCHDMNASLNYHWVIGMAVDFITDAPKALLAEFNARIDQEEPKGKINTWSRNKDGYYTHDSPNWKNKAWFKPSVRSDRLTFSILTPAGTNLPTIVYGYYHGHLTETFLNHFDKKFASAISSATPGFGDVISDKKNT
jgi:hypothetical protein